MMDNKISNGIGTSNQNQVAADKLNSSMRAPPEKFVYKHYAKSKCTNNPYRSALAAAIKDHNTI
jgi:hypothetical protein